MPKDYYIQPDAVDRVLSADEVLKLVRQHVPEAQNVNGIDESGGEARTYLIDEDLLLKQQRPHRVRPRTCLRREVSFLQQLEGVEGVTVPRVLGYGHPEPLLEYTVMSRMPGVALRNAELSGAARVRVVFDVGRMLQRIHGISQRPLLESRLFIGDRFPVDVRWRFGQLFDNIVDRIESTPDVWTLSVPPQEAARAIMRSLPDVEECVALHSNPSPQHVFVDPHTQQLTGLIDFGDAYFSHPTHDLRRWLCPNDRQALWNGYLADSQVSKNFQQTWQVTCALADMMAIVQDSACREAAEQELRRILDDA